MFPDVPIAAWLVMAIFAHILVSDRLIFYAFRKCFLLGWMEPGKTVECFPLKGQDMLPQILLDISFLVFVYYYADLGIFLLLLATCMMCVTRLMMCFAVTERSRSGLLRWRSINFMAMNFVGYLPLLYFGINEASHGLMRW